MKVITIGGATEDVIVHYNTAQARTIDDAAGSYIKLPEGSKIEVVALTTCTGGGATNSAVSFARLGYEVAAIYCTGVDAQADAISRDLIKDGIAISHAVATEMHQTGRSFIFPTEHGDRTIFAYRGANGYLQEEDIPHQAITKTDIVYITSLSGQSAQLLPTLARSAQEAGALVANNPGTAQLRAGVAYLQKTLPYLDILILNAQEAQQLLQCLLENNSVTHTLSNTAIHSSDAPPLMHAFLQHNSQSFRIQDFCSIVTAHGPKILVVTDGAQGAYCSSEGRLLYHPSVPATIANTLGAGDAFGSCFVACIGQGLSLDEALVRASLNAASVISFVSAKEGLLDKQQLNDRFLKFGTKFLKTFSL